MVTIREEREKRKMQLINRQPALLVDITQKITHNKLNNNISKDDYQK